MRVATWNLDHASNGSRPVELQMAQVTAVAPDLIVLTETCFQVDLIPLGYHSLSSARNCYGKNYCVLWSRFPIVWAIATCEPETTVCAEFSAGCVNIIVYGTVIPYHYDKVRDGTANRWQEQYRAIEAQGQDWQAVMRETQGKLPLIVAGDFNQTRDGSSGSYGTKLGRDCLVRLCPQSGLSCLTTEDYRHRQLKVESAQGMGEKQHRPHLCQRGDLRQTGVCLSDHNGVYVISIELSMQGLGKQRQHALRHKIAGGT